VFDFDQEKTCFEENCIACGACVEACPIIPLTDIRDDDPGEIMASVMDLYRDGKISEMAKTRIFSCTSCSICLPHCPEDLNPGLGLCLARSILRDKGEPLPHALSFLLPDTKFNFMKAVEAFQITPVERPWITDVAGKTPAQAKTVFFTGCSGILQPDVVLTGLEMIRRIDPTVKALGGVDYCCGQTTFRVGDIHGAGDLLDLLIEALNALSPERVVFLCPTCKAYVESNGPKRAWSSHFITEFLADRLEQLGPLNEVNASVTIHDPCHTARGEHADVESPRKLLGAIPGLELVEMENSREKALCCGASAVPAVGKAGIKLRAQRLKQAGESGADILGLYCPGCQSIFASEGPKQPFRIESVITILGRAMGIVHEDKLKRYFAHENPEKALSDAERCIEGSELPKEALVKFGARYFK